MATCGILCPDQGSNLASCNWECWVLNARLPGKSPEILSMDNNDWQYPCSFWPQHAYISTRILKIYCKCYIKEPLVISEKLKLKVAQLCLILCDPTVCSLQGSSVHGIFQARIWEWVAISFSRGSSWPRNRTWVSRIAGRCFTLWATIGTQFQRGWL